MKIGIIGGGFMGLVLAQKLAAPSRSIKVFEQDAQIGGLATYHDYKSFIWDRFYHVILPGDAYLLQVIKDLGLEDKLRWKKTYTGVYVDKHFYSVSNNKEFLLFPPLNLIQKFRLAFTILYASRIRDWREMEKIKVEDWLIRVGGKKTYEKFWKPLLLAKLGDSYKHASAVFIWTYIKRLFEARNSSAHQEQMGYVEGGYKTIFNRMEEIFPEQGVELLKETSVQQIRPAEEGGIFITHDGVEEHFDKVIFTAPVNVLQKVVDTSLIAIDNANKGVEYLGVVCMILLTRKPLTDFYVLNIADDQIPFTGVIGISTLVDTRETAGHYMTYLPKYIISDDPILRKSDDEIKTWFLEGVYKMYPHIHEEDIVDIFINRAFKVQPLQVLNYSTLIPKTKTLHPDFFVLNTSQFVNDTLNNNAVARHVSQFLDNYAAEILQNQLTESIIQQ
ncbi:MAG: NAD(P)/FAD-dependent oxidoreductase [Saprospiraceae bacterium]|nr:NAD(P)/FAD-dependent oxidoreductase [Saprospiraceae bacterium]